MISIIMPVYQTEEVVLRRAVDSVRRQRFSDWELLIVDDNDAMSGYFGVTERLKREVGDRRVRFFREGVNRGANAARNTGLDAAKGELIAFCDSDDAWEPDYLAYVADFFAGNPGAVLLSSSYRIIYEKSEREMRHKTRVEDIWEKEIYKDQCSPTTAIAVRREALFRAGKFDEKLEARQDYDMWLRVCRLGECGFTRKIFANIYRDGAGHERISSNYLRHIRGTEQVLAKILSTVPIGIAGGVKAAHYEHMAIEAMKHDDGRLARGYVSKMLLSRKNLRSGLIWCLCRSQGIFHFVECARDYWLRH